MRGVRPSRWPGGAAALLGLALLGGVATMLSVVRMEDAERSADERAAALVADRR